MSTSSTNIQISIGEFLWDHRDATAVLAVVLEAHLAVNLREQRVVLAEPDVQAGLEAPAFLAHENRAARNEVAVVAFDAESLRVAVAAVA
jgi:hypothetical protein